ncbi:hypothetical protein [Stenotrophomonas maltophilia]|uniref:hypothetical protein n=1 Tax=Stenotrophomonas maltophilia TaxID=40324 RepID=UPI000CAE71F8|nr:hypothetical protein [Stenotrophomonas maltophilia]MBH1493711.1 hypothetical protein [Stenotrophomonas maltophilia]MBN4961208.1 hypothetical protein [Stenotrophomonas maltophilia]PJL44290.1 hypothetical protein B9Y56_06205 [Stenotrophomonas maltophilia]
MLGWFFLPYRGAGVSFTSRFMRWHGETFLGRPDDLGLKNVPQAVKESYYDLAEDRPIELQQHNLKAWSLGQQHAEEARQVSKAEIPKATFLAVMAVSFGCVLIAAPFSNWGGSPVGMAVQLVAGALDRLKSGQEARPKRAAASAEPKASTAPAQKAASPSKEEATAEELAALRAECEDKWKRNDYSNNAIVRCRTIWNELGQEELK